MPTPIQVDTKTLLQFLNIYFFHPFWRDAQIEDPWIRIAFARSKHQIIELKRKKPEMGDLGWFIESKVWKRSEFGDLIENGEAVRYINYHNSRGSHCYYYPNVAPFELELKGGRQVRDSDITNVLFLGIDFDYSLPVGIKKILVRDGRFEPWMVCQTSKVGNLTGEGSLKKYQALIGVGVEDGRGKEGVERGRAVGRELARVLGGDVMVSNPATLLRLPGSFNWKEAEKEGSLAAGYCQLLELKSSSRIPLSLDLIEHRAQLFKKHETGLLLAGCAPERTRLVGARSDVLNGVASSGKLFPISWREAVKIARKAGEISAREGERHTALVSWAGGLAWDVGAGKLSLEEAIGMLRELGEKACEGVIEAGEMRGIERRLRECWERDEKVREEERRELLETLAASAGEVRRSEEKRNVEGKELESGDLWEEFICHPTVRELEQIPELDENTPAIVLNSSEWLIFLSEFMALFNAMKGASSGRTRTLIKSLVGRMKAAGCMPGALFCAPKKIVSADGVVIYNMAAQLEGKPRAYLLDCAIEGILDVSEKWKAYLLRMTIMKHVIKEIEEAAEMECSRIDTTTGKTVTNKEQVDKIVARKMREFFRPEISWQLKRNLMKALEEALYHRASQVTHPPDNCVDVVFQNGIYNMEDHRWKEDKEAWRGTINAMWAYFDVELGTKVGKKLRSVNGSFGNNVRELLEGVEGFEDCGCPRLLKFFEDSFPGDYETWGLVMVIMGYCMLQGNPHQVCFNFHGITQTGKTTLAGMICKLVGEPNFSALDYQDFGREYEGVIKAVGKTVMFVDEAESDDVREHARVLRTLKKITSGNPVSVRGIYRAAIEVPLNAKVLMTTNKALEVEDTSGALQRRMIVLRFDNQAREIIPSYDAVIIKEDGRNRIATIAAMALSVQWGLGREMFESDGSIARTEGRIELAYSTDKVRSGIEAMFILSRDDEDILPWAFVREAVVAWVEKNGGSVSNEQTFAKNLRNTFKILGIRSDKRDQTRTSKNSGRKLVQIIRGVKLRNNPILDGLELEGILRVVRADSEPSFNWLQERELEVFGGDVGVGEAILKSV